jgi:hypothetical protein
MTKNAAVILVAMFACTAFQAQDGLGRERTATTGAEKDALEGKAPPIKLEMEGWINGPTKAPTWDSLKGSVILLDFWAFW